MYRNKNDDVYLAKSQYYSTILSKIFGLDMRGDSDEKKE